MQGRADSQRPWTPRYCNRQVCKPRGLLLGASLMPFLADLQRRREKRSMQKARSRRVRRLCPIRCRLFQTIVVLCGVLTVPQVVETIQNLTNGYGAHAVICTAGSPSAYDQALKMLRRKGTLVCVGLPRLDYHLQISPMEMVVRSLTVVGSSVGTAKELQELLQMASEGTVVPHFIVFGLEEVGDVIVKLERSGVAGRVVLRISSE